MADEDKRAGGVAAQPDDSEPSPGRQAELHAAYEANRSMGKAPYYGVNVGTRQELSWVLLAHGWEGVLPEHAERQGRQFHYADLDGADLHGIDLHGILLSAARLEGADLREANLSGGACLEGAKLARAKLCGANLQGVDARNIGLSEADLSGADLRGANLSGATLHGTKLHGANLTNVRFDVATNLADVALDGETLLADIVWNDVPLTRVAWDAVQVLGEESEARRPQDGYGQTKNQQTRLTEFGAAVRANRQLATALRGQGLNEHADYFAYRAQLMQRQVLRRQGIRKWPAYIGSLLLDLLAGYGYRPGRAILLYLTVIIWFANFYVWASHGLITLGLPPSQVQPLAWYEALILSVSSFHGRGFQPFQNLNDPVAALAGIQAVFGLVIEVSFIATFTQRYFGK